MSPITNGTFDIDLNGWTYSQESQWPYCNNAVTSLASWDSGKAKIFARMCASSAYITQTFTIIDTTISFDYDIVSAASNNQTRSAPVWSLVVHVPITDPNTGYTTIVDQTIVNETLPLNGQGVVYKDISTYISNDATITFNTGNPPAGCGNSYCGNIDPGQTIWIDNVINSPNWGTYRVSSVPSGANISIGGPSLGITPDTGTIDITHVPIGSHTIMISKTDYYTFSKTDYIYPGRIYNISATLNPEVACITFYTDPTGAKIYLSDRNGQTLSDTGFTTFKQICNLFWGDYKWRLDLPGYIPESGMTTLTGTGVTVNKALILIGVGCIYFNTDPPGAKIILDEIDTGKITPYTICNLGLGQHCYVLTLSGYIGTSGCVTLTSIRGESVIATLTSCPTITLSVDKASVFIGDTVMLIADTQPAGQYPIIFKINGVQVGTCNTNNGTCIIIWHTTGLSAGSYAISAEVEPLSCITCGQ